MMKKYQVYISSTYLDLKEERREAVEAIIELGHIPVGTELFPSSGQSHWEYIRRTIDECDYYIVIVGALYGSVDPNSGKSFTELEYEYALKIKKPILAFLIKDLYQTADKGLPIESYHKEQFEAFRANVLNRISVFFDSPSDLRVKLVSSLTSQILQYPQKGWIQGKSNNETDNSLSIEVQKELYRVSKKLDDLIFLQSEKVKTDNEFKKNDKVRIFIGSSSEGLEISRYIQTELSFDYHVTIWNQGTVFGLGDATIESLERAVQEYDFAIFVFSPDDQLKSRGLTQIVARDNVIFELGLFIGKLSRLRTFVVHPRNVKLSFPSDLLGLTMASFDSKHPNLQAALGPACNAIRDAIKRVD